METRIEKVKRKLWSFGFQARGVADIPGVKYDLLVANRYPVRVVAKGEPMGTSAAVTAVVDGDSITYHVCKGGKCWQETSPLKAFPIKS